MSLFNTVNILDLADIIGEEEVQSILSDFSCEKNMEIEVFVRKNALDFSKKRGNCPRPDPVWEVDRHSQDSLGRMLDQNGAIVLPP